MRIVIYIGQQFHAYATEDEVDVKMLRAGNRLNVSGTLHPIERVFRMNDDYHVDLARVQGVKGTG